MKRYLYLIMALLAAMTLFSCSSGGGGSDEEDGFRIYYVAADSDGGKVPVDTREYQPGEYAIVLGNTGNLTREGYEFRSWTDGDGMTYYPGDSIDIGTSTIYLTADWEVGASGYRVTYSAPDADSGTVPIDSRFYTLGDTVAVLGNTGNLARSGMVFAGWTRPGNTHVYQVGDFFTIGENVTLTANWSTNTGGTLGHTYNDTLAAFQALGQGLLAATGSTDSSDDAYCVHSSTSSTSTTTYYLAGYTYNSITLNGSLTYSTNTDTMAQDKTGTVNVSGNDVTKIIYNIHAVGTDMSGTYGYEFTDGSRWTHNLDDNSFIQD